MAEEKKAPSPGAKAEAKPKEVKPALPRSLRKISPKPIEFADFCGMRGIKGYSQPGFKAFVAQVDHPRTLEEWDAKYKQFRTTPV